MREKQLAGLIIQMGLDQGVAIEHIMAELADMQLPSFVNSDGFRKALLDAVEEQLRAQLEARLAELRRQFVAPHPVPGQVRLRPTEISAAAIGGEVAPPDELLPNQDLPRDATMIWPAHSPRPEG